MTEFTPVQSLLGGAMIGLAAVLFMAVQGRIAGISGIASRLFPPYRDDAPGPRAAFIAGVIAAPLPFVLAPGITIAHTVSDNLAVMLAAGLLVGFGTVWGNGCTSGHGVCGLSRLSVRSLTATAIFMATAAVTVFVVRHVIGG